MRDHGRFALSACSSDPCPLFYSYPHQSFSCHRKYQPFCLYPSRLSRNVSTTPRHCLDAPTGRQHISPSTFTITLLASYLPFVPCNLLNDQFPPPVAPSLNTMGLGPMAFIVGVVQFLTILWPLCVLPSCLTLFNVSTFIRLVLTCFVHCL